MNRRRYLKALAAAGAAGAVPSAAAGSPIQLHVELDVEPSKEKDLVANFQKVFAPTIRKQAGFVDVKLLKLRGVPAGSAPSNAPYRLLISFQTEEQRQKWVAHDEHQRVWPTIQQTLRNPKVTAVLYDTV